MTDKQKWHTAAQQIDRQAPEYAEGARAAAAGVPLDARHGQLWMWGWVEQRLQSDPPSLRRH